jgi:hypothetical protein
MTSEAFRADLPPLETMVPCTVSGSSGNSPTSPSWAALCWHGFEGNCQRYMRSRTQAVLAGVAEMAQPLSKLSGEQGSLGGEDRKVHESVLLAKGGNIMRPGEGIICGSSENHGAKAP